MPAETDHHRAIGLVKVPIDAGHSAVPNDTDHPTTTESYSTCVGDTSEDSSNIFSLIQMCYLPSAKACRQ